MWYRMIDSDVVPVIQELRAMYPDPPASVDMRVLEDTQEIGSILARHDLIITPDRGLIVGANEQ